MPLICSFIVSKKLIEIILTLSQQTKIFANGFNKLSYSILQIQKFCPIRENHWLTIIVSSRSTSFWSKVCFNTSLSWSFPGHCKHCCIMLFRFYTLQTMTIRKSWNETFSGRPLRRSFALWLFVQTHTECIPLELMVTHHLVEVHKTLKTQLNHCCSVEIVCQVLLS